MYHEKLQYDFGFDRSYDKEVVQKEENGIGYVYNKGKIICKEE